MHVRIVQFSCRITVSSTVNNIYLFHFFFQIKFHVMRYMHVLKQYVFTCCGTPVWITAFLNKKFFMYVATCTDKINVISSKQTNVCRPHLLVNKNRKVITCFVFGSFHMHSKYTHHCSELLMFFNLAYLNCLICSLIRRLHNNNINNNNKK